MLLINAIYLLLISAIISNLMITVPQKPNVLTNNDLNNSTTTQKNNNQELKPFQNEEGKFSILMPGEPTKTNRVIEDKDGKYENNQFLYTTADGIIAYSVSYMIFPAAVIKANKKSAILDSFQNGYLSAGKLRVVQQINYQNWQG